MAGKHGGALPGAVAVVAAAGPGELGRESSRLFRKLSFSQPRCTSGQSRLIFASGSQCSHRVVTLKTFFLKYPAHRQPGSREHLRLWESLVKWVFLAALCLQIAEPQNLTGEENLIGLTSFLESWEEEVSVYYCSY